MNIWLERIVQLRKERGWSLYRLAEESGINQSTMTSWYRDDSEPKISSIEKICAAFGIPMSQFFSSEYYPIDITDEEKELLNAYRQLNNEQRRSTLQLINSIPDKIKQ